MTANVNSSGSEIIEDGDDLPDLLELLKIDVLNDEEWTAVGGAAVVDPVKDERQKHICDANWTNNLKTYKNLEQKVLEDFHNQDGRKIAYTYLLLDPNITKGLPYETATKEERWNIFIKSIFYIGKGSDYEYREKEWREYRHLKEALSVLKDNKEPNNKKVQKILSIWSKDNKGVIALRAFQHVLSKEAYTYEAAMIEAIGIGRMNLTNKMKSRYYGVVREWEDNKRLKLGFYLLFKAMNIFIWEGERQIRPENVLPTQQDG